MSDFEPVTSWVATAEDREERVCHARLMVGLRLAEVRYVDIDYHGIGQATRHGGPRQVVDEAEWRAPSWRYPGCDSVDYGVELTMTGGRTFTVTWTDPHGRKG